MPIEESIQWKPLRDPHYVVASLQPADGGRRKIFVRQPVLARVEALVRAHARHAVGLLLGQFYQCSVTGAEYLVIESISESGAVIDENEIATRVAEALEGHAKEHHLHLLGLDHRAHVVGWYRGAPAIEAKPSLTTAGTHASLFNLPWQMTLVVSEGGTHDGVFFLRDTVNSRWFYAPFYELLSNAPPADQAKATVVEWAQYLTAEPVVLAEREVRIQALAAKKEEAGTARKGYERPLLRRSATKHNGVERNRAQDADVPLIESSPSTPPPAELGDAAPISPGERMLTDHPTPDVQLPDLAPANSPLSDRPAPQPRTAGLADVPRGSREVIGARGGGMLT